jgi:hypothetical protein
MFCAVGLAVLTAGLVACGPSKPTGSNYLGKWEGTGRNAMFGRDVSCHFDISTVGQSFLIKGEGPVLGDCAEYGGIFILTPEGNLRRGNGLGELVISFDKDKNQAIVSAGGELKYWIRAETLNAFLGTWQFGSDKGFDASGHYDPIGGLQIVKLGSGQYQLVEGSLDYKGAMSWREDAVPLDVTDGKLEANIQSASFRAAHGTVHAYHLTIERVDDNDVLYTVPSDLSPETHRAHRVHQ